MSDATTPTDAAARVDALAVRVQEAMTSLSEATRVVQAALEELKMIAQDLKAKQAAPPA
jgi:phage-related protein